MLGVRFHGDPSLASLWELPLVSDERHASCHVTWRTSPTFLAPAFADARRSEILAEHPEGLRPHLHWWTEPAEGFALAHGAREGMLLVSAHIHDHGRALELWAADGVAYSDLQQFLSSSVIPMVARVQDLFLLHAGGLMVQDRLFAFMAHSGEGKSTTLLLAQRALSGSTLFADDVIGIRFADQGIVFEAGARRVKADPKTLAFAEQQGLSGAEAVFSVSNKRFIDLPQAEEIATLQLGAIFAVERAAPGEPGSITPTPWTTALPMLDICRSLPFYRDTHTTRSDLKALVTLLVNTPEAVWTLRVPDGLPAAQRWIRDTLTPWVRERAQSLSGGGDA